MPLADILAAIDTAADAECHRILVAAEATAAQVRDEATADVATIHARHLRDAQSPAQHECARRLNRARLTALRARSRAREHLFAEALARAQAHLAQARQGPNYPRLLRALVVEAVAHLDSDITLRADPRDADALRAIAPDIPISFDLTTWGGVEARTRDGRVVVINTLEARLAQAEASLRPRVMPLFDGAAADSSLLAASVVLGAASRERTAPLPPPRPPQVWTDTDLETYGPTRTPTLPVEGGWREEQGGV